MQQGKSTGSRRFYLSIIENTTKKRALQELSDWIIDHFDQYHVVEAKSKKIKGGYRITFRYRDRQRK